MWMMREGKSGRTNLKNCSQTCSGSGTLLKTGTNCHSHMKPQGKKAKKVEQSNDFTQPIGQDWVVIHTESLDWKRVIMIVVNWAGEQVERTLH
jgi:hypothetical protein